jgi:hypothetical protein
MGSTTPLWVPLVVAIIGLLATIAGTIAGVLITQRRSDARNKVAWERERERERERWAREDAARTFELRREAYVEFHDVATQVWRVLFGLYVVRAASDLDQTGKYQAASFDVSKRIEFWDALEKVSVYGSGTIAEMAQEIGKLFREAEKNIDAALKLKRELEKLLKAIRADLGIPVGAIESPPATSGNRRE